MPIWQSWPQDGRVDLDVLGLDVRPHIKKAVPTGDILGDDGNWVAPGAGPPGPPGPQGPTPAWTALLAQAWGDGVPSQDTLLIAGSNGNSIAKPIATDMLKVVRLAAFRVPGPITVNRVRYYTANAELGGDFYQLGIYDQTSGNLVWSQNNIPTAAGAWNSINTGGVALTADRHYLFAFGTTAGTSATAVWRTIPHIATASKWQCIQPLPGNLAWGSGKPGMLGFAQYTKTLQADSLAPSIGAMPGGLVTAAWAVGLGTLPIVYLDNDATA